MPGTVLSMAQFCLMASSAREWAEKKGEGEEQLQFVSILEGSV